MKNWLIDWLSSLLPLSQLLADDQRPPKMTFKTRLPGDGQNIIDHILTLHAQKTIM